MTLEQDIFRRGSTTYYWSSRFFPKAIRTDVQKLYSFVRTVDDYVDATPPQADQFRQLQFLWNNREDIPKSSADHELHKDRDYRVVQNMMSVAQKYAFDPAWVPAFFAAMRADLALQPYRTLSDTLHYTHGSAEVIGLMMGNILGIPPAARKAAALQGRAMQWINFIRDIAEDTALGRCYFPEADLQTFNLPDVQEQTARTQPMDFIDFMRFEIERYQEWQLQAEAGYRYIPRRLRIPLRTAASLYEWTAEVIRKDPFIVFEQKVKPGRAQRVRSVATHLLH